MKNFTLSNVKKHFVIVMFLFALTLGVFAQPGSSNRAGASKGFEVMVKHYPDPSYANSPYVKVLWGDDLNPSFVDFEDETIPAAWDNSEDYPWIVADPDSISGYNGSFCMMSGNGGVKNSTSTIQVTYDFGTTGGSISFLAGCYGEGTEGSIWDACSFYIDNELTFENGELQSWDSYLFEVSAGTHTFKWTYSKDGSVNNLGDGFYVDDVTFTLNGKGRADATYNLYRKMVNVPAAVDPDLILEGTPNTQYVDEDWLNLAEGAYQYGVVIVGDATTGIFWSDPITKTPADEFHIVVGVDPDSIPVGTVTGAGTFYYGEKCTLTAIPADGYQFYEWVLMTDTTELVVGEHYAPVYSFTVTKDDSIVARFEPLAFYPWITSEPEEGGWAVFNNGENYLETLLYGDEVTIVAHPNEIDGYQFVNWTCVIYDQSIDLSDSATYTFTFGETFLNQFELDSLAWDELYGEGLGIEFIAHFKLAPFEITVTVDPQEGGTVTGEGFVDGVGTFEQGETCSLTATANTGYHFAGWAIGQEVIATENPYEFNVEGSADLVAYFEPIYFNAYVEPSPDNGGFPIFGDYQTSTSFIIGDEITLKAQVNDDYTFVNWTAIGYIEAKSEFNLSSDTTYTFVVDTNFLNNVYASVDELLSGSENIAVTFTAHYEEYIPCLAPIEVTATEVGTNFAVLDWTETGEAESWMLFYRYDSSLAFDSIEVSAHPFTLENLTQNTTYEVYVAPSCGYENDFWDETVFSETIEFTTEAMVYSITATANPTNGGTITGSGFENGAGEFQHGSTCELTATANPGYSFTGWSEDGTIFTTDATISFEVTGARTLVAHFELLSYTISATANPEVGGTVTGNNGTYNHFDICELTATANEGYTFTGWSEDGTIFTTDATISFEVTGARTLVANFELLSYTITATANPEAGGTVTGNNGTYNHFDICELTATANEGYTFTGWSEDGTVFTTDATISFEVTGPRTLVAHFERNSCEITARANPEDGGTVTGAGTYDFGATCTLKATAATGYTFYKWTKDGKRVSTRATYTFTVSEGGEYVAHFVETFDIVATANPEAGGTISGTGIHNQGSTATLKATAAEGYTFENWTEDGETVSTDAIYSFEVTGERTLVANFTLNSYEITATANPAEGGTVTGEGLVNGVGTFDHFATCTLTATANEGYTFAGWTEGGETISTDVTIEFTVEGERTLVANFTLNSYEIMAEAYPEEGGTIEGAGTYNHFETCELVATPSEVYHFLGWTEDGETVSTDLTYSFEVTGARSLVAYFLRNTYEIVATVEPAEGGTVTGAGTYEHSEICELTAIPNENYTFAGWVEDGVTISTDATYSFEVTGARTLVANFSLNSYEIAVELDPAEGGEVIGAGVYLYGELCELTAYAMWGYTFVGWSENGETVTTDETFSFTVEGPRNLVAHFSLNSYEVTATANPAEGGTITGEGLVNGVGSFNHGATCTMTATANEGYTFENWTENGTVVSADATIEFTVEGERTLVANFTLNNYEITATANPAEGGTITGANTYPYGSTCTLTATAADGYSFENWTENGTVVSNDATIEFTVEGERTLVANFTLDTYAVLAEADPVEGGTITGIGFENGEGDYDYGTTCTLTATANEGYTFVNWTKDDVEVSNVATYSFTVEAPAALVAHFSLNSYEITATANPAEGGTIAGANTYPYGSTCTLTATAADGYSFENWTENGTVVSNDATIEFTVEGERTLVANFTLDTYAVLAEADPVEGGTITGVGFENGEGDYDYGTTCTLTATANEGYTFVNWTKDDVEVSNMATYSFTVEAPAALVAHFSLNSYEITATANPSNGGTIAGANTYPYGSTCMLTATANEGYTFENWTENGTVVSSDATYSFEVTGARTLVANFSLNSYEITATANPSNAGTVAGANTYPYGSTCMLTATAAEGYTFTNWTENGMTVSTDASYSFTVTGARTLVANFTLNSYEITATANPSNAGTISGANTYPYGSTCMLTATAAEGYTFTNWTENGTVVSTDATYSFEVTGARTLVANFTLKSYTITASSNPTEGGSVTGAGTYLHFFTCTLTAIPSLGYTFESWTKDGEVVSTEASYSFVVTASASYVANFTQSKYHITANTDPENSGDIEGTGFYLYGETCTLTVTPHEDYRFINWTLNGNVVSEDESISFVVTEEAHYVAHLENTVGIIEQGGITVSLFPNPAKDKLTIEASEPVKMYEVYTINGALVSRQSNGSDRIEIDVESYAAGTYLIRLTTESTVEVRRFVKE